MNTQSGREEQLKRELDIDLFNINELINRLEDLKPSSDDIRLARYAILELSRIVKHILGEV